MAKYTIHHTCGHDVTVQLFGKYADRERRIAYLQTLECEECRRAEQAAAVAEAKAERGLQALTGSEKQIAWADQIREAAYCRLDELTEFVTNEQAKQMVEKWKQCMEAETTAAWWIDHRHQLPSKSEPRETVRMFNELFNK